MQHTPEDNWIICWLKWIKSNKYGDNSLNLYGIIKILNLRTWENKWKILLCWKLTLEKCTDICIDANFLLLASFHFLSLHSLIILKWKIFISMEIVVMYLKNSVNYINKEYCVYDITRLISLIIPQHFEIKYITCHL